jgi:hypothetical protein
MDPGWVACIAIVALNVIVQIFWKPYLKAYAEEMGKRLAAKEDIQNLLVQVRAVTRETEVIKAQISGGLWQQQWHLGQKRDTYTRLIDTLENIEVQRGALRRAAGVTAQGAARRAEQDAIADFRRARALARLTLRPEIIPAITQLIRTISAIDPVTATAAEYAESKRLISTARDAVVELGRQELGLDTGAKPA